MRPVKEASGKKKIKIKYLQSTHQTATLTHTHTCRQLSHLEMTLILCLKILMPCNPCVSSAHTHTRKERGEHCASIHAMKLCVCGGELDLKMSPETLRGGVGELLAVASSSYFCARADVCAHVRCMHEDGMSHFTSTYSCNRKESEIVFPNHYSQELIWSINVWQM